MNSSIHSQFYIVRSRLSLLEHKLISSLNAFSCASPALNLIRWFLYVTILNWPRYGFKEPRFHFPLIFSTTRTIYPPRLPRKFIQPINAAFDFLCVQGKRSSCLSAISDVWGNRVGLL